VSSIKTKIAAGLAAILISGPATATHDLVQSFAECAGRYSAEMEHAWLIGDPAAVQFERQRSAFVSLLEATMPADAGRAVLHYRIDVKLAHAALLQQASFSRDERRAARARSAAQSRVSVCRRLLLGS